MLFSLYKNDIVHYVTMLSKEVRVPTFLYVWYGQCIKLYCWAGGYKRELDDDTSWGWLYKEDDEEGDINIDLLRSSTKKIAEKTSAWTQKEMVQMSRRLSGSKQIRSFSVLDMCIATAVSVDFLCPPACCAALFRSRNFSKWLDFCDDLWLLPIEAVFRRGGCGGGSDWSVGLLKARL